MILAVINVYGPLSKKQIIEYVREYFSYYFSMDDELMLDNYLQGLLDTERIFIINNKYSAIEEEILDEIDKDFSELLVAIGDKRKEYSKEELIKFDAFEKLYGCKEFDELREYYDSLIFKNKENKESLFSSLCYYSYSCIDTEDLIKEIKKNTKNLDKKRLMNLLMDYSMILPKPYLNGFSYKDIDNMKEELLSSIKNNFDEYFTDEHRIKTEIKKKPYGNFSYEDCIELAKKVDKLKLSEVVDSDKVLEFYINGKPTFVQILGHYSDENAIMIFKSKEDMINTNIFMNSDIEKEYPDIPMHISNIEISFDNDGFLNEDMKKQLQKNNLPLLPNFSVLETCRVPHLPNQEELNLIGAVLSDIIKLVQLAKLEDIKQYLGETEQMYDIYQVYVGDNEVLFGEYNDIENKGLILNFDLDNVDEELVSIIKRYRNYDIEIGTYISYFNVHDINEYPHVIYIIDKKTKRVIDCFLKKEDELKTIKNDVLKILLNKKMNPRNIYVNNDYCFEIFAEYGEYFNIDISDDDTLNDYFQHLCSEAENWISDKDKTIYKA